MPYASREIRLVRRPVGMPTPEDFHLAETEVADPGEGELVVQNLLMSVDPYMRPRLAEAQALDVAMDGGAIGRVVASRNPSFAEGQLVRSGLGFREYFRTDGRGLQPLAADPSLPLSVYMHALGGTGFTAYGGLLEIGKLKDGEQVFVSTAAGAVGSVVAQVAKIKGCYVVGSTGSDDKVRWLTDQAGIDVAINYKTQPIIKAVEQATPKGIDVYFDNVGGEHLEAALTSARPFARFALCGMISQYNATDGGAGTRGLIQAVGKQLRLEGFIVSSHFDMMPAFVKELAGWVAEGKLTWKETVEHGIENAPAAFLKLFTGENMGKMLVKLG